MIYVDEPIGTGFSYADVASPPPLFMWKFFQELLRSEEFPKYTGTGKCLPILEVFVSESFSRFILATGS